VDVSWFFQCVSLASFVDCGFCGVDGCVIFDRQRFAFASDMTGFLSLGLIVIVCTVDTDSRLLSLSICITNICWNSICLDIGSFPIVIWLC